ncbi:MAG: aminodeoxychorismate synthase component I [Robiginitomaculum sp.]|nr:aminodeoxychorismate synthase component I [Robiginitomaculum sp.]
MTQSSKIFVLDIPWREPLDAFAPLAQEPWALAFISSGCLAQARWSILCAQPDEVIIADGADVLSGLSKMQRPLAPSKQIAHFPFVGGLAGLLSYELGAKLENLAVIGGSIWPDMAFGNYPCCALFDHQTSKAWVVGPDQILAKRFASCLGQQRIKFPKAPVLSDFRLGETDEEILDKIRRTIDYIHAGDIFQANISRSFLANLPSCVTPFELFGQLVEKSAAPFCVYFRLDEGRAVLSSSPERFIEIDGHGTIQTHPIKGTRPRGRTQSKDIQLAKQLQNSTKDRAENLMIVDLMRNDLSRVCMPGSVTVPELFTLQSYANVHHLVSTIRGKLRQDVIATDVLRAIFPPGSITGAPKIRAMQIISELEQTARGPYCGTLGFMSRHFRADFNVLIRTMRLERAQNQNWDVVFRAGGGIVADSDPAREIQEMIDKASIFTALAGGRP